MSGQGYGWKQSWRRFQTRCQLCPYRFPQAGCCLFGPNGLQQNQGLKRGVNLQDFILEMKDISKYFSGVTALSKVNFQVERAHIHALVGENGAGKSTLINILSGVYPHGTYDGRIVFEGEERQFHSIQEVEDVGIACIHQELNLVPEMNVMENIFLHQKPGRFGIVDSEKMYLMTRDLLNRMGLSADPEKGISPHEKVKNLGIGQKQMVEIMKALSKDVKLLILDEPTAALSESEVNVLLDLLKKLKDKGVTCIFISHRLDEVLEIADDITVLRDGQTIDTRKRDDMDKGMMIHLMVGRELNNIYPKVPHKRGKLVFEVRDYSVKHPDIPGKLLIDHVSLQAYQGEILGISGLMGAGRTEFFTSIFGAFREKGFGEILIEGKTVRIRNPIDALRNGYVLLTEDRKRLGLNLMMSVKENITLASLRKISHGGILDENSEAAFAKKYVDQVHIKTPSIDAPVKNLSGGNQQKVAIGKSLMVDPKIMVLDEPTRGIDVGSKWEIYKIMNELVERGVTIIMISSEMEEILGMSDRILTMCDGRITGEFDRSEASQEILMKASVVGR
jgi:D-xylose transport system ATP-binding protein